MSDLKPGGGEGSAASTVTSESFAAEQVTDPAPQIVDLAVEAAAVSEPYPARDHVATEVTT